VPGDVLADLRIVQRALLSLTLWRRDGFHL